jgi:glycine hydroxymethyltransferase
MKLHDPVLAERDPEIAALIREEEQRETDKLRLIPSENYVSRAVLEATGSVLTNKYSEGYAGKRYYEGQQVIDRVEELAITRLKALFGAEHVNVQPYSGSPANLAVYLAFCQPGDSIMGLGLPSGGHLTHGWNVSITGKYFQSHAYGVKKSDQRIDFDQVRALAREHKPKILWAGTTAYPRVLEFEKFREIAD